MLFIWSKGLSLAALTTPPSLVVMALPALASPVSVLYVRLPVLDGGRA